MKNVFAIQTARAGSKSVVEKNKQIIHGMPLFLNNALFAKNSQYIKEVYITTDDADIKREAIEQHCKVINRSPELSTDSASHYDVIKDALLKIEAIEGVNVDYMVVLLGNNCHAYTTHLDMALEILDDIDSVDSVISVSKYNMFHPYRAYKQTSGGYLTSYIPQEIIRSDIENRTANLPANDKNAFPSAYFFNGSFWIIRRSVFLRNNGIQPFPWLGTNIYSFVQPEGIMELDAPWQLPLFKS